MTSLAIDGPAGAGKSYVARAVARSLGFRYLDTGAMYRALAWVVLDASVDPEDEQAVARLVSDVDLSTTDEGICVDGRLLTTELRSSAVTEAAAIVAQHQHVRQALVEIQRRLAQAGDVVMEGRDIGTEVLPDAELKIFLTASLDQRALRRVRQLGLREDEETLAQTGAEIAARDEQDRTRAISPLTQAPDAVVVDTTQMTPDEVVERICGLAGSVMEDSRS